MTMPDSDLNREKLWSNLKKMLMIIILKVFTAGINLEKWQYPPRYWSYKGFEHGLRSGRIHRNIRGIQYKD